MMRFSVIVPALNEEKHINQCLSAINNQTFDRKKYEIIVVDGNSTDKTAAMAKKYAEKVVVEKKHGIARARNVGAAKAEGEICVFVDCDTVLERNVLAEFDKAFHKRGIVCATGFLRPSPSTFRYRLALFFFNAATFLTSKLSRALASTMCIACKADLFRSIGGFDETLSSGEDIDFALRITRFGKLAFVKNASLITSMRRIDEWGFVYFAYRYSKGYVRGKLQKKTDTYEPVRF